MLWVILLRLFHTHFTQVLSRYTADINGVSVLVDLICAHRVSILRCARADLFTYTRIDYGEVPRRRQIDDTVSGCGYGTDGLVQIDHVCIIFWSGITCILQHYDSACAATMSRTIWKAPRMAPSWIFSEVPAAKLCLWEWKIVSNLYCRPQPYNYVGRYIVYIVI